MNDARNTRISRRRLLTSAAGLAVAATAVGRRGAAAAARNEAVEVLVHDELHDGAAFAKGRLLGPRLRGGLIEGDGVFESAVIASPFPFTHAGIHWTGRGRALSGVRLEARTSLDGAVWTPWRPIAIEAQPEETAGHETYGALLGAPRHNLLQYRAYVNSQAQLATITTTFLNSQDGPRREAAPATLVKPPDVDKTREEWGCDDRLRFRGRTLIWPAMFVPVKKLIVHHTATDRVLTTDAEVDAEVRAIYTYHARTLGWGDIGYHRLLGFNGKLYEGRHGRGSGSTREVGSQDVVAGHSYAHNYGSFSISLIGYFHPPYNMQPTSVMLDRLVAGFENAGRAWRLDPHRKSPFLKSDGGWNTGPDGQGLIGFCGHRDTYATACPGDIMYALLNDPGKTGLRSRLAMQLTHGAPPNLAGADGITTTNNSLTYTSIDASERAYSLEGWYKASNSEAVSYLSGFDSNKRQIWTPWPGGESITFNNLGDGHYTLHLRKQPGDYYEANKTVHIV